MLWNSYACLIDQLVGKRYVLLSFLVVLLEAKLSSRKLGLIKYVKQ